MKQARFETCYQQLKGSNVWQKNMHLLTNVKANQLMQGVLVDQQPQQTIKYLNSFTHNKK